MSILDMIIEQIKESLTGKKSDGRRTDPRPASEDPYGDPADLEPAGGRTQANVRPASEDPLGDPADLGGANNIRPASEDPLGDPADEEDNYRRRR